MDLQCGTSVAVTQKMLVLTAIAGGTLYLLNLLPLMASIQNLKEMPVSQKPFLIIHHTTINGMPQQFVLSLMISCGTVLLT